ncbi:splicing factor, arginine/serine-rich 19-like [Pollicipes pollicipes]|uniref:splicing factor, arginine/serine-rich 19-like n=1 Tax=Pollicipes pollicipes TaxID=41117 RepID=UPI00188538D7|nr:splicing factor, arginine/serine-rich 19-like [Pollicipes pollicipes]
MDDDKASEGSGYCHNHQTPSECTSDDDSDAQPAEGVEAVAVGGTGHVPDVCPICLHSLRGREVASPDVCQHMFCLHHILQWSKVVTLCPVDRRAFSALLVRRSVGGAVIGTVPVRQRQAADAEAPACAAVRRPSPADAALMVPMSVTESAEPGPASDDSDWEEDDRDRERTDEAVDDDPTDEESGSEQDEGLGPERADSTLDPKSAVEGDAEPVEEDVDLDRTEDSVDPVSADQGVQDASDVSSDEDLVIDEAGRPVSPELVPTPPPPAPARPTDWMDADDELDQPEGDFEEGEIPSEPPPDLQLPIAADDAPDVDEDIRDFVVSEKTITGLGPDDGEEVGWKKFSRSARDRNYRDGKPTDRAIARSKEVGEPRPERKRSPPADGRKGKKRDIQRYDVRKVINERKMRAQENQERSVHSRRSRSRSSSSTGSRSPAAKHTTSPVKKVKEKKRKRSVSPSLAPKKMKKKKDKLKKQSKEEKKKKKKRARDKRSPIRDRDRDRDLPRWEPREKERPKSARARPTEREPDPDTDRLRRDARKENKDPKQTRSPDVIDLDDVVELSPPKAEPIIITDSETETETEPATLAGNGRNELV